MPEYWIPKQTLLQNRIEEEKNLLQRLTAPFQWISENVTEPFGAIATSPFTPPVSGTEGMNWFEREQAEYAGWQEPEFTMPWGGKFRPTKGIVESLPWLALPSAGGIAGRLGGLAAKGGVIGRAAVEAVPGKIIGKAIGKVIPSELTDPTLQKLYGLLQTHKLARKVTKKVAKVEWGKRVAAGEKALTTIAEPEKAFAVAKGQLRGEIPKPSGILQDFLKPEEVSQLRIQVKDHPTLRFFEKIRGNDALTKLLSTDDAVQPNEIKLLNKLFPGINEIIKLRLKMGNRAWRETIDALNIPKAVLASVDMSNTLRQGSILLARRPQLFPGMMKWNFKTLFSDKNWQILDDIITTDPDFGIMDAFNLYLAPKPGGVGALAGMEESFMSHLAERIPILGAVVRASERSFTAGLNYLRYKTFKANLEIFRKTGMTGDADMEGLAKLVNWASGRGDVPKGLVRYTPAMNALMFAPRFVFSRLQLPTLLFSKSPAVRGEATRTLVSALGAGLSVVSLAAMAGAKVELDPRSSDFGKVKIGNTRLDIWAGYVQWARFLSQLATAQRKIVGTGQIADIRRWDTMWNLIQSKESPMASIFTDLLKGETYLGQPIFEGGWETVRRELKNRLTPLFVQDMWDAIQADGLTGGLTAAPGFLGVGVTSYKPELTGRRITPIKQTKPKRISR